MRDDSQDRRFLTPLNILFSIVTLILVGLFVFFAFGNRNLQDQLKRSNSEVAYWNNKLDTKVKENNRVIYLPSNSSLHLNANQTQAVKFLTSFFNQVTTFQSPMAYKSNYKYALTVFDKNKMPDLYKNMLITPSLESEYDLQSLNMRTQVFVTGPNSYQVVVVYLWHHDNSDMYAASHMNGMTQIYNIKGRVGAFTACDFDSTVNTKAVTIPYSQFQ